jgi:hypothetical protein
LRERGRQGRAARGVTPSTCFGVLALCTASSLVLAADALRLTWMPDASAPAGPPAGWEMLTFSGIPKHTQYRLVPDDGGFVVEARAQASASGLIHRLQEDPAVRPLLRWRWKVDHLLLKADVGRKQGDDYPARIYVTFAYEPKRASFGQRIRYEAARLIYGEYPPYAGLNYIWEGKTRVGSIVTNAYTDRVRMLVVESGPARLGQWLEYERDILQDYRAAFGADPPMISGVAIMTDADDTRESALAYYGEISLHSRP